MDTTADVATRELVLTRVFAAPRRLVFRAWTDQAMAARWWTPEGFTPLACRMEVQPGGAWQRVICAPDGREVMMRGRYLEIVDLERLVFTFAINADPETLVTVTFAEIDGKTELTLRHTRFATDGARDAHTVGWTGCLAGFARWLADTTREPHA